jgi:hypothetical protein
LQRLRGCDVVQSVTIRGYCFVVGGDGGQLVANNSMELNVAPANAGYHTRTLMCSDSQGFAAR